MVRVGMGLEDSDGKTLNVRACTRLTVCNSDKER